MAVGTISPRLMGLQGLLKAWVHPVLKVQDLAHNMGHGRLTQECHLSHQWLAREAIHHRLIVTMDRQITTGRRDLHLECSLQQVEHLGIPQPLIPILGLRHLHMDIHQTAHQVRCLQCRHKAALPLLQVVLQVRQPMPRQVL